MTLKELETQLQSLTITERADAIQILTHSLNRQARRITKTIGVMGGDACLANTRLPVWLFVSLQNQGSTDAELLEAYPQLSAVDLVNVWAYADAHAEEIAIALQEQEEVVLRSTYDLRHLEVWKKVDQGTADRPSPV
jgi:uncharacterized protein (DUF433 family)